MITATRPPDGSITLGAGSPHGRRGLVTLGPEEQRWHTMVLGKSGQGKSSLLLSVFCQQVAQGRAVGLLEPHADLSEDALRYLIERGFFHDERAFDRLLYIDFGSGHHVPFNILAPTTGVQSAHAIALNALEGMVRAWPELTRAPMFATLFLSAVMVLQANNLAITHLYRVLSDADFRGACMAAVTDPLVRESIDAYDRLGRGQANASGSLWRRSFLLQFSPVLRYALGQPDNVLDFRRLMDEGKSVILNLGNIPDADTRRLLGALLLVQIEQAALSRASQPVQARRPFTLLVDEWSIFSAQEQTIATLLEQCRKYGLTLWLSGQSLAQVPTARLEGAFENTRLHVAFALGQRSAAMMARVLTKVDPQRIKHPSLRLGQRPVLMSASEQYQRMTQELQALPPRRCYVKLNDQEPVRIETLRLPPIHVDLAHWDEVTAQYRRRYQRSEAEAQAATALSVEPLAATTTPTVPAAFTAVFGEGTPLGTEAFSEDSIWSRRR